MHFSQWIKSVSSFFTKKRQLSNKIQSLNNLRDANRSFAILDLPVEVDVSFSKIAHDNLCGEESIPFSWQRTWSSGKEHQNATHYQSRSVKGRMFAIAVPQEGAKTSRHFDVRGAGKIS
jgi:hypothetical protein